MLLTVTWLGVAFATLCVFLINVYLDYLLLIGTTVKLSFSTASLFFFLRPVLSWAAAYPVGRYGNVDRKVFVLLFIAPSLFLFHGIYISEANGMLELWPPFLFLDLVFFSPALILHDLGRRKQNISRIGPTQ